jgi:monoamine oxidase
MEAKNEKKELTDGWNSHDSNQQEFDVIVVGAGAAGLMGAMEIALTGKSVAVVEATDRIGGRIFTFEQGGKTIEMGAEFIHGNLPLTKMLLKKADAKIYEMKGSIWQHKKGALQQQEDFIEDYNDLKKKFSHLRNDKPVAAFLAEDLQGDEYKELRFSLKNYVEGYYAADTEKASTAALCEELMKGDDKQYRIEGGYQPLVNFLEQECRRQGGAFKINQPVVEIGWEKNKVTVTTNKDLYRSRKALITVPMGVLQEEFIRFTPALPWVVNSAKGLGFGHVIKLVLCFEKPFWKDSTITGGKDLRKLSFLFSEENIPTWWTHHPNDDAMLTGWIGGPKAEELKHLSTEELQTKVIAALGHLFNIDNVNLQQQLVSFHFHNWSSDTFFRGAYSYEVVGGAETIQNLQQPVEDTLFFAGEGLHNGPEIGTVEGALQSGKEAAHRLILRFND